MNDNTELWQQTIKDLQHQMTAASFHDTLAGSYVASLEGDRLIIHVSSAGAEEWLNARPPRGLAAAVASNFGQPLEVLFTANGHAPAPAPLAREAEPGPAAADPLAAFDFGRDHWVKHPRYLSLFYQPYLASFGRFTNRAYGVWQFVRDSFDLKNHSAAWVPVYRTSLHDLAAATGCTPHQLAGVWAFCSTFNRCMAETGEALPCCGRYNQAGRRDWPAPATEQWPEGRPVCRYWKAGIFQLWAEHGLAVIKQSGTSTRTTFYEIQICRWPLLLTPYQMARLPETIQRSHREFLQDALKVDLGQWGQIEQMTLATARQDLTGLEIADGEDVLSLFRLISQHEISLNRLNRVFFAL